MGGGGGFGPLSKFRFPTNVAFQTFLSGNKNIPGPLKKRYGNISLYFKSILRYFLIWLFWESDNNLMFGKSHVPLLPHVNPGFSLAGDPPSWLCPLHQGLVPSQKFPENNRKNNSLLFSNNSL